MAGVQVVDKERTGDVVPGDIDSVTLNSPTNDVWRLISIEVSVDGVPMATSGCHEVKIRGQTDKPEYFRYQSHYFNSLELKRGEILSADRIKEPRDETVLCNRMADIQLDWQEGVELYYSNQTDAIQTNNRNWKLRFRVD